MDEGGPVRARARQPAPTDHAALDPRIARSRAAIIAAASEHFPTNGYLGANIDDIAADARVSKRTVYNIFGGKEQLFRAILAEAFAIVEQFSTDVASTLADADDVAAELRTIAVTLVRTILSRRIVRMRRLLIGEAERFPELAKEYYRRAPDRVMDMLAEAMDHLDRRGLLSVDNPRLASEHFAFLILGAALDRALFTASDHEPLTDEVDSEVERRALEGVDVFMRAYGPRR